MFTIEFTRAADRQLDNLRAYERGIVVDAIEQHLGHEPAIETRRRKKLRPNEMASWELRVGDVRVLYDINEDANLVLVIAIGVKEGDRLMIDGEEVDL